MNKIYRLVWNKSLRLWTVVSEIARGVTKNRSVSSGSGVTLPLSIEQSSGSRLAFTPTVLLTLICSVLWSGTTFAGYEAGGGTTYTNCTATSTGSGTKSGNSVAVGNQACAAGNGGISVGSRADSNSAPDNIAIGSNTKTGNRISNTTDAQPLNGGGQIAIGKNAQTDTAGSIAIGNDAKTGVNQNFGIAVGGYAEASGNSAIALGRRAGASGGGSVSVGSYSSATATNASALGANAAATAASATAVGYRANASSDEAVAIGAGSEATGTNVTQQQALANRRGAGTNPYPSGAAAYTSRATAVGQNNKVTNTGGGTAVGNSNTIDGGGFHNIAIGQGNRTTGDGYNTALGVGNELTSGNSSTAIGVNNRAAGNTAIAMGRGTNVLADFGIGLGSTATVEQGATGGISLGNSATTSGIRGIAIGSSTGDAQYDLATAANASGTDSIALGTSAKGAGSQASAVGRQAKATGANAAAYGNEADANGTSSVAVGDKAKAQGDHDIAIGLDAATASGGSNNIAMGNGVTTGATGQNVALGSGTTTANAASASGGAVAIGRDQKATGDGAVALGDPNTANGNGTVALGRNNTAAGDDAGDTAANGAVAIGNENKAIGQGSVALGNTSTAAAAGAIALGDSANAQATNGVALGSNAVATNADDVALGSGSQTSTASGAAYRTGTAAPSSVVSVGTAGNERRIQNVSAGAEDTDAVNVSQLRSVQDGVDQLGQSTADALGGGSTYDPTTGAVTNPTYNINGTETGNVGDALAELDKGWTLQSNGANAEAVKAGDTVDIGTADGEENLQVAKEGNNIKYSLNRDLKVDSVTAGDTVINNDGMSISGGPSMTKSGIDAGGTTISNVAPGVAGTDAVNKDQLDQAGRDLTDKGFGLTAQDGTTVQKKLGEAVDVVGADQNIRTKVQNGQVAIELSRNLDIDSVTAGDTVMNNDGVSIANGPSMTKSGIDAAGNKITNVADGDISPDSKDAINGSQLANNAQSVADALGGGSTVNPDGTVSKPTYNINGTETGNVGDALAQLDKGWTLQSNGTNAGAVKAGDTVDIGTADGEENLQVAKEGNNIKYSLNRDLKVDSVTAGDTVINNDGMTISGGPSMTKSGIDAGGTTISNVAPGVAGTDAVNKDQLDQAGQDLTDKGFGLTAQDGTTVQKKLGEAVDVIGADDNISTKVQDGKVAIELAKDLNVNSVTAGDTVINNDGMTISGGPSVTKSGIDAAGNKISNVAAGTEGTDAVNLDQLKTTTAASKTEVEAGKNMTVDSKTGADGQTIYTVATADDVEFNSVKVGDVTVDGSTGKITGVTDGDISPDSKDAINGSQLANNAQSVADALGGGSTVNPDGTVSKPTYNINGTETGNVGDALAELDKGWTLQSNGTNAGAVKAGDTVDIGTADGEENLQVAKEGNNIKYSLNRDLKVDSVTAGDTVINNDGMTISGGPSMTKSGIDAGGTTISNVAPGVAGTDAVNKDQLDQAGQDLTDKGFGLTAQDGTTVQKKLGEAVDVIGADDNISTKVQDGKVAIELAKDLNVNSVTAGDTVINNDGMTISGGPSVTKSGIDAAGNKISNVAAGTEGTDAVNLDQLKTTTAASKTEVEAGKNMTVDRKTGADGQTIYTVATADDVEFDSVKVGDVTVDGSTGKITGVTDGDISPDSKDAINGSQLANNAQSVADALGGGSTVNPDGTVSKPTYNINGTETGNVGDALAELDKGWTLQSNGTNAGAVKAGDTVDIGTADGEENLQVAKEGNNIKYSLNRDLKVDSVTAGDTVINNDGMTISGGPSVTKSGIDAAGNKISNVAAGTEGTDAVNLDQLKTTTAASKTEVEAGKNMTVDRKTGADGQTIYTVATADDVEFDSVKVGDVTVDGSTGKITGVTDGDISPDSKDAINGSQLANNAQSVADALGGGSTVNPDGTVSKPTYNINGTETGNVGDALAELDKGWTLQSNGTNAGAVKAGDTVDIGTADGEENLQVAKEGNNIKYSLNRDLNVDSVTAGNTRLDNTGVEIKDPVGNSTSIVAGGTIVKDAQGNSHANSAAGTTIKNAQGDSTLVNATGLAFTDANGQPVGPSVSRTGMDAGDLKVTHVAPGTVSADSTDAINGSQLNAQGEGVKNIIGGNTVYDPQTGGYSNPDIGGTGQNNINDAIGAVGEAATKAKTTVTQGDNIVVTESQNPDGSRNYEVATAKDVSFDSVKVGDVTVDGSTGKITGVTDGDISSDSKDAINGSQLANNAQSVADALGGGSTVNPDGTVSKPTYNINGTEAGNVGDALAELDKGWTLQSNGANAGAVKAGDTVDIGTADGEENLQVAKEGNNIKYSLNRDLSVDSVTAGDTVINNDGMTISGGPSVTKSGIDAGQKKVTGVAAGTISADSTDAINGSQINAQGEGVKNIIGGNTAYDANTGTYTNPDLGGTGQDNINDAIAVVGQAATAAKTEVEAGKNMTVDSTTDADGHTIYTVATADDVEFNSVKVGDVNIDGTTGKITGVTDGDINPDSKDAINGSQLAKNAQSVADALGGGSTVNPDGTVSKPTYNINGTETGNVGDALAELDKGWTLQSNGANAGAVKAGDTVDIGTADDEENLQVAKEGNTIKYSLNRDLNVDSITTGDTLINTDGMSIAGGPSVTKAGINAGNRKITGVAPGAIRPDSTDAINGSQLHAQGEGVKNIIGGNTQYDPDTGKYTNPDIGGTGKDNINDAIGAVGEAAKAAKSTVSEGKNIVVKESKNADGSSNYEVSTSPDLEVDSVTAGGTRVDGNGLTIDGGPSVTKDGIDAGDKKVSGVADGEIAAGSKDAVNGGQLKGVSDSVANVIGGNTTVNPDGSLSTSNIGGTGKNNVNDAIEAVKNDAKAAKTTVSNKDNNLTVNQSQNDDGSTNYEVGLADKIKVKQVDADQVNAGQVNVAGDQGTTSITGGAIAITGPKGEPGPSMSIGGIHAGGKKVTSVADGAIAQGSQDAINGGQLHQSYQDIGAALGGGAGYDPAKGWTGPSYEVAGGKHDNVGDALGALDNADKALGDRITNLGDQMQQAFYDTNQRIDDVKKHANAGVAAAMALETAPYISGKYTYAVGAAYHGGENAVGVTLRKTADNGRWSLTTGVAAASQGDPSFRVGLSGVFD
ncbi:ESPR-type extended signal peptide-containing protein [Acinetobacter sp. A47]|uniref:ESPR-type extended signal peptide-containing protein n=1 Tax=Acinetobacter sp. A47 TaxID=1561217 RepID=UPI00056EB6CB|nr:ESPR-type extended signal peptide-containing protein [Acinetobacter sp. A47]